MKSLDRVDLITLPIRAAVLLFLLWSAYSLGYGEPQLDERTESPEQGVVATYSLNGRPWQTFHDRNADKQWDMWVDERGGSPYIVSIDDNGDGKPDRYQDETGRPLPWQAAGLRVTKSINDFIHNQNVVQYTAVAVMVYVLLEFLVRSTMLNR